MYLKLGRDHIKIKPDMLFMDNGACIQYMQKDQFGTNYRTLSKAAAKSLQRFKRLYKNCNSIEFKLFSLEVTV